MVIMKFIEDCLLDFWEVYNKNPSTGFIIQKLNEELDKGDVLFKGSVITKLFICTINFLFTNKVLNISIKL